MADLPGQFEFSHRTQRIINQNNSFIFGTKIQIHNFATFSEN